MGDQIISSAPQAVDDRCLWLFLLPSPAVVNRRISTARASPALSRPVRSRFPRDSQVVLDRSESAACRPLLLVVAVLLSLVL